MTASEKFIINETTSVLKKEKVSPEDISTKQMHSIARKIKNKIMKSVKKQKKSKK